MQENEFSGTLSMYHSTVQPLCTHVDKLVTSNLQICFPAPYLSLHAKYSHMPNMPLGRTSPARTKILDGIHLESKRIPSEKVTDLRKSWRNTPGHVFFSKSRRTLCL